MTINRLPFPETRAVFYERLLVLCVLHNARMTSSGRTEQGNAAVGGHPESKHLLRMGAWGVDLVPDLNTPEARLRLAKDARLCGIHALVEDDHVHCQGRPVGWSPDWPSPIMDSDSE